MVLYHTYSLLHFTCTSYTVRKKILFLEIIKAIAVLISGDDGSPGASVSSATDHQSQVIRSQSEQTRIPRKTQSSIDNHHSGNNRSQHSEERIQRIPRKTDHDQTRLPRVSEQSNHIERYDNREEQRQQRPYTMDDLHMLENRRRYDNLVPRASPGDKRESTAQIHTPSDSQQSGPFMKSPTSQDSFQNRHKKSKQPSTREEGVSDDEDETELGYDNRAAVSEGYNGDDDEEDYSESLPDFEMPSPVNRRSPSPVQRFTIESDIPSSPQIHRNMVFQDAEPSSLPRQRIPRKQPGDERGHPRNMSVSFQEQQPYSSSDESDYRVKQTSIPRKYPSSYAGSRVDVEERSIGMATNRQINNKSYQDNQAFEPEPDY